jgi:hypothetical protein
MISLTDGGANAQDLGCNFSDTANCFFS